MSDARAATGVGAALAQDRERSARFDQSMADGEVATDIEGYRPDRSASILRLDRGGRERVIEVYGPGRGQDHFDAAGIAEMQKWRNCAFRPEHALTSTRKRWAASQNSHFTPDTGEQAWRLPMHGEIGSVDLIV